MLAGCTPWPDDYIRRYRERGYWEGKTIPGALAESIARRPGKIALVHGSDRFAYAELGERVERIAAKLAEEKKR